MLGVAAVAIAGAVTVGLVLGSQNTQPATVTPTKSAKTPLRLASEACSDAGELSDDDRTLFLDMKGEELGSGDLGITNVYCVLSHLDTPSYVTTAMENTRALDGRQSEEWGRFSASWTYHPDDGLDILIRQVK